MNVIMHIWISQYLLIRIVVTSHVVAFAVVAGVRRVRFIHDAVLIDVATWQLISMTILIILQIKSLVLIQLLSILVVKTIRTTNFLIVAGVIKVSSALLVEGILPFSVWKLLELFEFAVSLVVDELPLPLFL